MALVAYGSSDESGLSDNEDSNDIVLKPSGKTISTATESTTTVVNVNGDLGLVPRAVNGKQDPADLIEDDEYDTLPNNRDNVDKHSGVSGLLNLPAPKASPALSEIAKTSFGLVAASQTQQELSGPLLDDDAIGIPSSEEKNEKKGLESMVYDDELEEEVKPKTYGDDLPKPKAKKSKQPVRITIPSLPDVDSDEDDEPKRKKSKSTAKCGLFSLLPAPKNLSIKEAGRQLVPHTLTRRPPPPKPAAKPVVKKPAAVAKPVLAGVPDIDSEEEEEEEEEEDKDGEGSSCFFSLNSKPAINATPAVAEPPPSSTTPPATQSSVSNSAAEPALRGPWMGPREPSALLAMFPSGSRPTANIPAIASTSQSRAVAGSSLPSETVQTEMANEAMDSSEQDSHLHYGQETLEMDSEETETYLQDEQFLRLQGKNKRGREAINIIDVNADDQLNPADLIKNLTEETRTSHSRKRKDLPSNQQRRKHQITYLAHQAKERELELKNQWAQNRQAKRHTQSKYGF